MKKNDEQIRQEATNRVMAGFSTWEEEMKPTRWNIFKSRIVKLNLRFFEFKVAFSKRFMKFLLDHEFGRWLIVHLPGFYLYKIRLHYKPFMEKILNILDNEEIARSKREPASSLPSNFSAMVMASAPKIDNYSWQRAIGEGPIVRAENPLARDSDEESLEVARQIFRRETIVPVSIVDAAEDFQPLVRVKKSPKKKKSSVKKKVSKKGNKRV